MASESAIIQTIKGGVRGIPNTRIKKMWSTGHGRDVDLLVVTHGLACFYEIKQPGEQPRDWQVGRIKYWQDALADAGWFDDADRCIERIRQMANLGAHISQLLGQHGALGVDTLMLPKYRTGGE